MPEKDPVVFADAGSVLIRESDRDSERAETRSAKQPAASRHSGTGGRADRITSLHGEYGNGASKIGRRNRYVYRHP